MEASKFIADMGLDRARHLANEAGEKHAYYNTTLRQWQQFSKPDGDLIYLPDLKRLIESHDIVTNLDRKQLFILGSQLGTSIRSMRIIQAFKDVAACSKKPQ